jgi:hypothetical protein
MEARNERRDRFARGGLAVETVLVLAGLAMLLAVAVKRMGGTDATVVAGPVHTTSAPDATAR